MKIGYLATSFFMLNLADTAMTSKLYSVGGVEANLLWHPILANGDFVIIKVIGSLAAAMILMLVGMSEPKPVKRILLGLVIGMAIICLINTISIGAYLAGL